MRGREWSTIYIQVYFKIPFDFILFYVYECVVCIYVCTPHLCLVPMESEEGIGSLRLELWVVVSHHVGVENSTWVFCKSRKCS